MRLDTAAFAVTALALIVPSVTAVPAQGGDHYIPRRRAGNRHNFVDGNRADAAARALLERATPEHKRLPKVPQGVGRNGRIDHDYTYDRKSKANPAVDSDPTYEISYLSKSEDDVVYEDEQPDGALRKRNPHEASCYDVPTFAVNGILGLFPPDERCTHVRAGSRSVAITCYHSMESEGGGGGMDKRSADEMHEERRMQFLSLCDTNTRPELMVN